MSNGSTMLLLHSLQKYSILSSYRRIWPHRMPCAVILRQDLIFSEFSDLFCCLFWDNKKKNVPNQRSVFTWNFWSDIELNWIICIFGHGQWQPAVDNAGSMHTHTHTRKNSYWKPAAIVKKYSQCWFLHCCESTLLRSYSIKSRLKLSCTVQLVSTFPLENLRNHVASDKFEGIAYAKRYCHPAGTTNQSGDLLYWCKCDLQKFRTNFPINLVVAS